MDKLPLLLDDFIQVLLPGTILTVLVAWLLPIPTLTALTTEGGLTLLLVLSFAVGHLIQAVSTSAIQGWAEPKILQVTWDEFTGKQEVETALRATYGDFKPDARDIEGLCLGPIQDRAPRRDSLVASANFNRAMEVVCAVIGLVLLYRIVDLASFTVSGDLRLWAGLGLCLLAIPFFHQRYVKLRAYGAMAAFMAYRAVST